MLGRSRPVSARKILYRLLVIVVGAGAALMGALGGGLVVYQTMQRQLPANAATNPTQLTAIVLPLPTSNPVQASSGEKLQISTTEIETAITQAVEKVGPAVVTVVTQLPGGRRSVFGTSQGSTASGSGVIITSDGYILTLSLI